MVSDKDDPKSDSVHVINLQVFYAQDTENVKQTTVWRSYMEAIACAGELSRRKYIDHKFSGRNEKMRRSNPNPTTESNVSFNSKNSLNEYSRIQSRFALDEQKELYGPEHMSVSLIASTIGVSQGTAHKRKKLWDNLGIFTYAHGMFNTGIDTGGSVQILNKIKSIFNGCGYKMYIDVHTNNVFVKLTDACEFTGIMFKREEF